MATVENKYKRRLMTAVQHVLPEYEEAAKKSALSDTDIHNIKLLVEHDNHDARRKIEKLVEVSPMFKPYFNTSLDEQRELAYRRLKAFCEGGIISVLDFDRNPMNIFMAHEKFGEVDGSYATKMTVQFNLWGGTVARLGSDKQKEFFGPRTDTAEIVGCFGLSELGYGNNAVEMETTATYDEKTQEFVVNSPSVLSQKYWITNGACHAHYCVVFAQLITKGEHQGVHGFIVPIRDQSLKAMPGCRVEDMGLKIGLNGIDNAKILFDNVRVPRDAMLTSYAEVMPDGSYVWKDGEAPKLRDRFLRLADQLLSGRLCISSMMLGGTKTVLTGALAYMATRMGVGPDGKSDFPILNYQLIHNEVFPLLARAYAAVSYHNRVKRAYDKRQMLAASGKDPAMLARVHHELIILCSSVKPIAAWLCDKSVITCRERVGGIGFLEANGFGGMFAHAGITAEGDARVLCAKVTKELMEILEKKSYTKDLVDIAEPKPVEKVDFGAICGLAEGHDHAAINECLRKLEIMMANRVAVYCEDLKNKTMASVAKGTQDGRKFRYIVFDVNLKEMSDEIQSVAMAYAQWEQVRAFNKIVCSCGKDPELIQRSPGTKLQGGSLSPGATAILGKLNLLYIMEMLQEDSAHCMTFDLMDKAQVSCIRPAKQALCKAIHPEAINLSKGLAVNQKTMYQPMTKDWKQHNAADNFGEVVDTGRYLTDKV